MTLYAVFFNPSNKLMMIAPKETIHVMLNLQRPAVDRFVKECAGDSGCVLHDTRPHGTVTIHRQVGS